MTLRSSAEISAFIKTTIEEVSQGRLQHQQISDEATILNDLSLDSLDYATIVLSCEAYAGIKVMDRDIDWNNVRTVRDLASLFVKPDG
jgi:acyl carrier protein